MLIDKLGVGLVCDLRGICGGGGNDDYGEAVDVDAMNLSHVGGSVYDLLRKEHAAYHHTLWDVSFGKMTGELHQTPLQAWPQPGSDESEVRMGDLPDGHDDWFPNRLCEMISATTSWCDIMSLGPPDGLFMDKFKEALANVAETAKGSVDPIVIRMMFGNIPAMPVNCNKVMKKLTEDLPEDVNINLWVGAWRKGVSWNHAKIIAVDGKTLWTGGHNLWDAHYLKNNPVHDLSLEMEGKVTICGHRFANEQWEFIEKSQSTLVGFCIDKMPDGLPMVMQSRVTITEFPRGIDVFPPRFTTTQISRYESIEGAVPIITMGRYGALLSKDRPSDDGFVAMLYSANSVIRLALQDLGPVCIPGTKRPLPGCTWPDVYLSTLAHVIWTKGVDVQIILSNPGSIPGGLSGTEACYGNGWTCVDVAAEIIKRIRKQFPEAEDDALRKKVEDNLFISFIREKMGSNWEDGNCMGMHAKHVIVDDVCTYIGSQNLYICDLAEWGVLIDDEATTLKIKESYWTPMWEASFREEDCDVQEVMDGLDIDRDGDADAVMDEQTASLAVGKPADAECFGDDDEEEAA